MKLAKEQIDDANRMATEVDLPNFSKAGTGKTHTALEAFKLVNGQRNAVLCPKIALHWWRSQIQDYLGADVALIESSKDMGKLGPEFTVTTYDLLRNNAATFYEFFNNPLARDSALCNDESQYIAPVTSGRTQAVFGKDVDYTCAGGVAELFGKVWPMTGTPKMNYANDYWTQVGILHPEVLEERYGISNYDQFERRFTFKQKKQFNPRMRPVWKVVSDTNEGLLHRILYEEIGCIRRTAIEGIPKLTLRELELHVDLPAKIRKELAGKTDDEITAAIESTNSIVAKAWREVGLLKAKQIVPYVGDSVKSSPVLLGCWHHDVMDFYTEHFEKMGLKYEKVAGDVAQRKRERIRDKFNSGDLDVVVGQMRAMGVAWNLQEACHHVIIGEIHPTPGVIEQFYKRVYRRGQEQACLLDIFCSDDPIDQGLNGVRKRKEKSDDKIHGV